MRRIYLRVEEILYSKYPPNIKLRNLKRTIRMNFRRYISEVLADDTLEEFKQDLIADYKKYFYIRNEMQREIDSTDRYIFRAKKRGYTSEVHLGKLFGEEIHSADDLGVNNPDSFYSRSPDILRRAMRCLPMKFYGFSENELTTLVRPNEKLIAIKQNIMNQFNNILDNQKPPDVKIDLERACDSIVPHAYFTNQILDNQEKLAWMITLPLSVKDQLHFAFNKNINQIVEIATSPLTVTEMKEIDGQKPVKITRPSLEARKQALDLFKQFVSEKTLNFGGNKTQLPAPRRKDQKMINETVSNDEIDEIVNLHEKNPKKI